MRDKWKEPILQNKEEQLAWTMAYDTGQAVDRKIFS